MAALRLVRKWGVPLATAASMPILAPVVFADSGKKEAAEPDSRMVRPSDLPIYEEPEEVLDFEYHGKERTSLEEGVGGVRKEIEGMLEATRSARERVVTIYETGKAHSMATMDYITDEENILPRAGAITVGGLAGLIIGARKKGGLFKRVLYTSTGVVTAASLCYPRQAYQISQQAYENTKDYATIGYNFVAGVKPQSKVSTPVEPKKEEASTVAEDATPLPKVEVPLAPETSPPATEPEGAEVRSVIPQILHPEKSPAPIDSLAQQASDVTQWGFRLTDKTSTTSSSPADVAASVEPTVPDGFGSVGEINKDSAGASAEQKVIESEAEVVNLIKEVSLPEVAEPAQAKGIPEINVEVVQDSAQKEEKVGASGKTVDVVEEVSHIADLIEEKVAEVIVEAAQGVEEDAMKVAKAAEVVEEVSSKVEFALGVVENIEEAAAEALSGISAVPESVMEKVDTVKEVTEEAEKVVETITEVAEKVEKVAEEIKTEAERIETQAAEGMQDEKKSEEASEKVAEFFTSSEIHSSEEVKEASAEVPDTEMKDIVAVELKVSGTESTHEEPKEQIRPPDSVEDELVKPDTELKIVDVVEGAVQAAEEKVVDTVEEKVSEVVIKVAEEVKDATKVAEATEVIEKVDDKVESALGVENRAEAAAEAAHYVPGVPEPVLEKIEQVKRATEETEVVDTVTIVSEKVEEVTEEIKKEAGVIETEAAEVIQSKEKKEEVLDESKVQLKPSGTEEETPVKPETETDTSRQSDLKEPFIEQKESDVKISLPVEEQGLINKLINFFSKDKKTGSVATLVEESTEGKAKEPSAVSGVTLESGDLSAEKSVEGVGVTEAKVEDAESQEILQTDVAKFAKDENIPGTVGEVLEPVLEEVSKDVEDIADKTVEKAAEVVKEAAGDIAEVISDIVKVTDVVEEVGDRVVSVLDAIQEKTEEAQETPGVSKTVVHEAGVVKQMSEGVEIVVEAVTYVADKVGDVADAIKTEVTALETQADELLHSEEKRKELIDTVTEFVGGIKSSLSDVEKDTSLELPAGELKESGTETTPEVPKEEKPEEKLAEVPAVEQVALADDSVPVGKEDLFDKLENLFSKDKEKDLQTSVGKTEGVITGTSIDEKEEGPTVTEGEVQVERAVLSGEELKESLVEPTTQETDRIEVLVLPAEELKEPIVEITPTVLPEPVPEVSTQEEIIKEKVVSVVESKVSSEDGEPKPVVREGLFDKLAQLFSKDEEKKDAQAVGIDSVVESVSKPTVEVKKPSEDPDAQEAKEPVFDKTEELVTGISDTEEKEGLTGIKEVPVEGAVSSEKLKEQSGEPTKQEAKESLLKRIKELVLPKEKLKESSVETTSVVLPEPEKTALPAEELKEPSVETTTVVLPEPAPEASAQEKESEEKSAEIAAVESIAPTEDSRAKPVVKEGLFDKLASLFTADEKDQPAESAPVDSITEKLKEPSAEPTTQEEKETILIKTEELVPGTSVDEEQKGDIGTKEEDSVEVVVSPLEELKESSGEPTVQEAKEIVPRIEETVVPVEELKELSVETASVVLPEPAPEASAQEKESEEKSADIAAVESITPTEESGAKPVVKEGLFDKLASLFTADEKDQPTESAPVDSITEKLKEPSAEPTTQEEKETIIKTEELVPGTSADVEEKEDLIAKKEEDSVEEVASSLEKKEPSGEPTVQEAREIVLDRIEETVLPAEELKEPSIETASVILPEPEETALPAEELKDPSVETTSVVLQESVPEASAQEKEPEEKSADIAAVESVAPTEDSVPKSIVKEGLFDKLASLFSKDEEKKDLPAVDRDSVIEPPEKLEEPSTELVTPQAKESVSDKTDELVSSTSIAAEEEGHIDQEVKEHLTKEIKSSDIEIPAAVELKESEKSSDQIPVELHKPVEDATLTQVKTEGFFSKFGDFFKDEEKKDAPVVVEPIVEPAAEELKEPNAQKAKDHTPEKIEEIVEATNVVTEEKESMINKLASLFSKDEEKKVPIEDVPLADSVVDTKEPAPDLPDTEVKEQLTEELKPSDTETAVSSGEKEGLLEELAVLISKEKEDGSFAESEKYPLVEETREIKELSATVGEATEPVITTPDEIVKDKIIESNLVMEPATPADQEEAAVVPKKKSFFGKIAGVFSGGQREFVSDSGTAVSNSSPETIDVLPDAAASLEELPKLDTKAEELVQETDTQDKEPEENLIESPVVEEIEPVVVAPSPLVEKEGLFDKLASFLSKDEDKKDVPATDNVPATDIKETDEKSADTVSVESQEPAADATSTSDANEGLFSKLTGFFSKDEEKKEVPAAEVTPASEPSELEGKSTNSGIAEVIEPAADTVSVSAEKGLFEKVANFFSKQEENVEEKVDGRASGTDSPIKELTETSSDLSEQDITEQAVEQKNTEVDSPTITKEKEGLFDKLAGLFSKEDTDNHATERLEDPVVENAKESHNEQGETSEQLSTMPEVSSVSSGDSSAVEVDPSESSVVQDQKSFVDKITTFFGTKKEPVPASAGDAYAKSSVEAVPDVPSEAGQGDLGETLGSEPLFGETANVPSESTPAIIKEESSLQVKDKGLFDRLAELVSGNEKKAVTAADEVSAESEPETLPGTSETVAQEVSDKSKTDSLETLTEPKSSIFDRVTNFFSNKESSKEVEKDMLSPQLVEEVPAKVTEQSENSTVTGDSDDPFVVSENPSSPVDVRTPEESGEQSGDAAGSAWRGWFRTGASVKQEGKDVIVQLTPPNPAETDYGQSNPEDSDMYTTRS